MTPEARALTKFWQAYAKSYGGGAYSAPMPADFQKMLDNSQVFWNADTDDLRWVVTSHNGTGLKRSFTGTKFKLPDKRVARIAHSGAFQIPVLKSLLDEFDAAVIYQEDDLLAKIMTSLGFSPWAYQVSASAEIFCTYTKVLPRWHPHEKEDLRTLVKLPHTVTDGTISSMLSEAMAAGNYRDDYPYYNVNNSWAAASLRGYKPDDPMYGVKPSEMSKKWMSEHPEDLKLTQCAETTLAMKCPSTMVFLFHLPLGSGLERVRFLKLTEGELLRHCDITDRDLGTRDGQICRLHVPLVTNSSVRSLCWDVDGTQRKATLEPTGIYYMDIRKPHAAINKQPKLPRIHLQIDLYADQRLRDAIMGGKQL